MHDNYMTPHEVANSAKLGNRIAGKLAKPGTVRANAAIRHAMATQGTGAAAALACQLLGINHADACTVVATLAKTKPDDIVSPHLR